MVPKGWSKRRIGDIAEIQVGRDLREDNYSEVKTEYHIYPVYSNTVEARGLYGFYNYPEYPGEAVTIVGRGVGLGTAFARDSNECFGAIGRLLVVSPKEKSFDVGYFADYINFSLRIYNESGGIPQLPSSSLANYYVVLPPLPEQKKIAQILSTWDGAIATTEHLLANSQQQKKALMQQLLTGKKRFPEFCGKWEYGRLGELCDFKGGFAFKEIYQGRQLGELPFIKVSDMNLLGNEIFIKIANNWVTYEIAKSMHAKPFPKGVIVFAKVGAALLLNRRRILTRETLIDNNMMAAIPKESVDLFYLYQVMLIIDFARLVQDGAVPSVNQSDLSTFKISYPLLDEQKKIAIVLTIADNEIETLKQKLNHLKQEKKALMQQLLTGKRRVKTEAA